jgi:hypothetical protein
MYFDLPFCVKSVKCVTLHVEKERKREREKERKREREKERKREREKERKREIPGEG